MDIRERIANAKSPEEMEQYLLDLDSEFRFKIRPAWRPTSGIPSPAMNWLSVQVRRSSTAF